MLQEPFLQIGSDSFLLFSINERHEKRLTIIIIKLEKSRGMKSHVQRNYKYKSLKQKNEIVVDFVGKI